MRKQSRVRLWRCAATVALNALAMAPTGAAAETILFVGNSFTFGALSPVRSYRPDLVTDLNGTGIGGVPALVATFGREAGEQWQISLETSPGAGLPFHYAEKRAALAGRWDVVLLQGYSTLDQKRPGDPVNHVKAAAQLGALFKRYNAAARINLITSWSRADQTYLPTGHWYGKPISAMSTDLAAANAAAMKTSRDIEGAIPVGQAWNRAMDEGLADPNPYDGIAFGQLDLWATDQYHASSYGYYLEALMIFGTISRRDPRSLGASERAGFELGFSEKITSSLQQVAAEELIASGTVAKAR